MSNLFRAIKNQSKLTDDVMVGFSTGKDSCVVIDLCFEYFSNVQPFFMYLIPGLEFQEETLRKYERRYGTEIIRLPHFEVSSFYRNGVFRKNDYTVETIKINDEYDWLRSQTNIKYIASGERIADSIVRRGRLHNSGSIDLKQGKFYPIIDWNKANVMEYIAKRNLYLSKDNRKFGFSFNGLKEEQLAFIKRNYVNDFKTILDYFPEVEIAVDKYEFYKQKGSKQ